MTQLTFGTPVELPRTIVGARIQQALYELANGVGWWTLNVAFVDAAGEALKHATFYVQESEWSGDDPTGALLGALVAKLQAKNELPGGVLA